MENTIQTKFRATKHGAAGLVLIIETTNLGESSGELQYIFIHSVNGYAGYFQTQMKLPYIDGMEEFLKGQLTARECQAYDFYIQPIQKQFSFPIDWTFSDAERNILFQFIGPGNLDVFEKLSEESIDPTVKELAMLILRFSEQTFAPEINE